MEEHPLLALHVTKFVRFRMIFWSLEAGPGFITSVKNDFEG
jgi:hypothetical protein